MPMSNERLAEVVALLQRNPSSGARHSDVGTAVWSLLTEGLNTPATDIDQEHRVVSGRIDALLGRTVFEFKSSLARERTDAETQLYGYLSEYEQRTGEPYLGVATDGFKFIAYRLAGGTVAEVRSFTASRDKPHDILAWLSAALSPGANLDPEPEKIRDELGKGSVAYGIAEPWLRRLWAELAEDPEVRLKRDLWAQQLERVYGSRTDSDDLFFQHTYLTIIAKTMATVVAGIEIPSPDDLLSGAMFEAADIRGAVEEDFFNWVLHGTTGAQFVRRTALQVERFRLDKVDVDVLKVLYESLIDPEQRHDLGEYYTPDWLASWVCDAAITDPLSQRVLDPACGSGTFVFHAARRYLAAAEAAGLSQRETVQGCCEHVFGIDVHPVAAIIARVTFLLALGDRLQGDRGPVNVPVYLGDSLQWNTARFLVEGEILMGVEGEDLLHFPASVASEPAVFDSIVAGMVEHAEQHAETRGFGEWLKRNHPLDVLDDEIVRKTYTTLKRYYDEGRNHIWAYVARNMSRPVWLASTGQRADVIVGNPPWLSYRYMSASMQQRFKEESKERGIWAGGNVATHQDLSALFYAKSVELYLQLGGTIALVMPYAALNRKQFEGFRYGWWGTGRGNQRRVKFKAQARIIDAWTFDEYVQPLFPVPSAVIFAENRAPAGKPDQTILPTNVRRYAGELPRRDASPAEAQKALAVAQSPWPTSAAFKGGSDYRSEFRQGATVVPRRFWRVERVAVGGFGGSETAPLVQSHETTQEKEPWKSLPRLSGQVEREFLRPLLLGESIAPFRMLNDALAVIPWDPELRTLLDAAAARAHGWPKLADWLSGAEDLWAEHASRDGDGDLRLQMLDRLDYQHELLSQFPMAPLRVLYAKSGTNAAAVVCRDTDAVIDHKLYWTAPDSEGEAYYLVALINSETVRSSIAHLQSRGQWGARDFDKVMFDLTILRFDPTNTTHTALSSTARRAEKVAAAVELPERGGFVAARKAIRTALAADGVAAEIEALVAELLAGA